MRMSLFIAAAALVFSAWAPNLKAQEISVPKKPAKQAMFVKNAKMNKRSTKGYLGLQAVILVPLGEDNYAVLYGSLAGKRKGDSFHYFENADLGFVCMGHGKPAKSGGVVTNECFLNGASTGKQTSTVPDYGKVSGRMIFNVYDNGDLIGPAVMQWGLSYANPRKLYRYLKANGG